VGIAMGEVVIADNTVTGSGVVLAQRIEQLADPGGVCITAALHEAIPKRMPFDLENLGEQALKGFDDPVRVYRVKLSAGQSVPAPQQDSHPEATPMTPKLILAIIVIALVIAGGAAYFKTQTPQEEPLSVERMAFPLPDKPSIAVLPFDNLSDDAQQEYFADGMTEDLITDISKVNGLFVIARNSVFTYKGKSVKIRQVAEELGVRYVLEGSVQRAGNQVRINAQLIDATTGGHIWAERYDGLLDDVFTMRDRITLSIVKALSVTLIDRDPGGNRTDTNSLEAYDAFLRGWAHYQLETPDDFVKAISYFENAIQLDPDYGRAHAVLAAIYSNIYRDGWAEGTGISYDDALKKLNEHLQEAMKNPTPLAHRIAAWQHARNKRWDEALAEADRAIVLDPNDPNGYVAMGRLLVNSGRAAEGLDLIKKAMRLDPQSGYLWIFGWAQFHLERYEEATTTFLRATRRNPEDQWPYFLLAAAYGHLGLEQKAISAVTTFNDMNMKLDPLYKDRPYSLAEVRNWPFKDEASLERLIEGLRKAGVPEGVTGRPANLEFTDLITVSAGTFSVEGAIEIDSVQAKSLHDNGVTFIDSRGKDLYGRGHIPAATNLYFHQVWDNLSQIVDLNDEVVFYCGDPSCHLAAHSSAQALILGYSKVYYFAGGFSAWENAGYPVEGS
jgi:adenylate cyclase